MNGSGRKAYPILEMSNLLELVRGEPGGEGKVLGGSPHKTTAWDSTAKRERESYMSYMRDSRGFTLARNCRKRLKRF